MDGSWACQFVYGQTYSLFVHVDLGLVACDFGKHDYHWHHYFDIALIQQQKTKQNRSMPWGHLAVFALSKIGQKNLLHQHRSPMPVIDRISPPMLALIVKKISTGMRQVSFVFKHDIAYGRAF